MRKPIPLVSIIITTKNEEKNIKNCLKSIKLQSYGNIEIIVVDNNSTDRTQQIARKYTKKIFNKGPERSAQRNFGMITKSKGEFVMFIDADMILSSALIEYCIERIKETSVIALHIPEVILGKSFINKVRRFERSFYNGTVVDGARFFIKDEFIKVGGFDEKMSGPEDWDIDKKIKEHGEIGLLPEKLYPVNNDLDWEKEFDDFLMANGIEVNKYNSIIFHNESEFDLKNYLKKKAYYSKSFDTYIHKWGKKDPDIKKQFGFFYRYLWVFIEKGKWKKIILHPILTIGMYYLRFLVGIQFLKRKKTDKYQLVS